jgi:hypothetical protein
MGIADAEIGQTQKSDKGGLIIQSKSWKLTDSFRAISKQ